MASVLTDFTKKREFLVCMDSDGCVMDTVSIKHTIVMCPELIRVFALDDHADFVASAWEEINLRNITRGLSRFESVVLVFDRLKNRGIEVPGSEDISAWVNTSAELSTASLQHELLRTGSLDDVKRALAQAAPPALPDDYLELQPELPRWRALLEL